MVSQADLLLGEHTDLVARTAVAKVRRWLDAPEIRQTNNAAVLICDDPDRLSVALAHHPRLCRIEVGLPAARADGQQGSGMATSSAETEACTV